MGGSLMAFFTVTFCPDLCGSGLLELPHRGGQAEAFPLLPYPQHSQVGAPDLHRKDMCKNGKILIQKSKRSEVISGPLHLLQPDLADLHSELNIWGKNAKIQLKNPSKNPTPALSDL